MKKINIGQYSPKNPKIDIFVEGNYKYSTNWFTRCKDARQQYINAVESTGAKCTVKVRALIDHKAVQHASR